ncbi:CGCGG family putative rSAM-modified RiPP protein [Halopiger aswanensis]|uniref:Putative CGCGG family rSAM target protein n=1 Tax=Halopiger aswanensis TaxID=148449 RepID=A0A419W048_9EURY|nr:CGCGG family rSAM-modified RiPP protein [Halopiger aswanensis]RKD88650.1 putative CGCGG family rSAM target protein [Halopiger aswanensis]
MSSPTEHDHNHDHEKEAEPITDRIHDNSWSANLEKPKYAANSELAIHDAIDAIEHTTAGNHVNLVTHAELGHPETFLYDALEDEYDGLNWEYIDQCGCGGHVTKVHVEGISNSAR